MCLAQGHNAVTPVRLDPAALWSRVKHSTTDPLYSSHPPPPPPRKEIIIDIIDIGDVWYRNLFIFISHKVLYGYNE